MVTSVKAPASSRLKSGAVKWDDGQLLLPEHTVGEHSSFVVSSMADMILHKQTAVPKVFCKQDKQRHLQ